MGLNGTSLSTGHDQSTKQEDALDLQALPFLQRCVICLTLLRCEQVLSIDISYPQ